MGKQDIVQVLLANNLVKVVFLDEDATAENLIKLVVDELEIKEHNYEEWKVILLSKEDHCCFEILDQKQASINNTSEENKSRYLNNEEEIFPLLENFKRIEKKDKELSSQSVQDIHDLSQHLHRACFKVVNVNFHIEICIKDAQDANHEHILDLYFSETMNFGELIKVIEETMVIKKITSDNQVARELSINKIKLDQSEETQLINKEELIINLISSLSSEIENGQILEYRFIYALPESWYNKMGSMTSRLTKGLSRPLSVYTFFGGNNTTETNNKVTQVSRRENLDKRKITSPSRMVRHMSLSGKDSETNVDLSTITTWISGDVGKLRKQSDSNSDANPVGEWAATYPLTRGLKQRERLATTNEEDINENDINELEQELNELDRAFLDVLDELNIKDAIRDKMMEFPPAKKLELIEQNEMVRKMKTPSNITSPLQSTIMSRPNSIVSLTSNNPNIMETNNSAAQASLESILSSEKTLNNNNNNNNSTGISNYLFGSLFSNNNNLSQDSVEYYLKFLNSKNLSSNDTFKFLQSLRIHLSTATVTWVRNFLDDGSALSGIEFLLEKYINMNISIAEGTNSIKIHDIDEEIHLECIRCLRVLLNTESGFNEVLKHKDIIKHLTFSINTQNDKIRKISTEVLAAICVLSKEGHNQILESLSYFRLIFHEEYRFQYLIHSLEAHVSLEGISAIAAYEYKTTCLSFINALVNTPETLDERMLLREEFLLRGLLKVFEELKESYPPESLIKQIQCYEEELEYDKNDLKEQILIRTLDDNLNHPILNLSKVFNQLSNESVLKNIINEIINNLINLLNNDENNYIYEDDLKYDIINLINMFCNHILNIKDTNDFNLCLKSFFDEANEFIGLNLREVLELSEEFKLERENNLNNQNQIELLKADLEAKEKELKEIKSIPIINYFIELKNKKEDEDEIDFNKSPKDNFTGLLQKLILKEKEITKLNERIQNINKPKSNHLESTNLSSSGSTSAIKEELDLQKLQNQELSVNLDSKLKEIAYLKRSLEAVCAKFQLKLNEYVPDTNDNTDNVNLPSDLISITELQILQAELEQAKQSLAHKEELEKELLELKNSNSTLKIQIQEQNIKLGEKDDQIKNLSNPNVKNEEIIIDSTIKQSIPIPPPPPPPLPFLNNIDSISQSQKRDKQQDIKPLSSIIPPPPPPPLPSTNTQKSTIPPPPPPPLPSPSTSTISKIANVVMLPPPPPPLPSIPQALAQDNNIPNLNSSIPPPPPLMQPNSIKSNKQNEIISLKPKVPMKALFWKKIPNNRIKNTIFENLVQQDIVKNIDLEELESLFSKKIVKKPGSGYSSIGRKLKGKKSITLLDFNRANNIAIALARMKMPFPAIRQAILEINDSRLSIDNLRSLENIAPTNEEIKLVKSYNGTLDALGTAEKYILQIMDIPRLAERLNCMIFRRKFDSDLEDIKPELHVLNNVIIELKDSKGFSLLIEIVLVLGNILNNNTPRGDAKGFKLEAFKLLKEIKANSNKTMGKPISSFLHYIAQLLEDHWHRILKLKQDFKFIEAAARVSVSTLLNNIYSLTQGVDQVKSEINHHKKIIIKPENDKFIFIMEKFVERGSEISNEIKLKGQKLEQNLEEILSYFGEDSSSTKPEDFFNLIISFLDSLEIAYNENVKLRTKVTNKVLHQAKVSTSNVKGAGLGQGDFDVAIRELRSGLRRKRGDRPRSGIFSLPGFSKPISNDDNESQN